MNIKELLKRIPLTISLDEYLTQLTQEYTSIGTILKYEPVFEGYEDANIILNTDTGRFALKIFANFRSKKNIFDYIKVIHEAKDIGVETLELVMTDKEQYFFLYNNTYSIITKFFDGNSFNNITPSLEEILHITTNIAKLNTLDFDIDESYDSWGSNNLLKEYSKTTVKDENVKQELLPIINYLKKLNTENFSKGVIHADMQRKHVLKNKDGICIIDYGCMRNDLKVYDISIFLAWFCLGEDNWDDRDIIYNSVLKEYIKINPLSSEEIESIIPLMIASYAAYYLRSKELIEHGDNSEETLEWHNLAKNLYRKSIVWSSLI